MATLAQTKEFGETLWETISAPSCVYLEGGLGAGKTTLCQAIIESAGYSGSVTSPTYNLIHEYKVGAITIYHMDLYRLEDPAELEYLGVADLWNGSSIFLVEWAERGLGYLPMPNFRVSITQSESGRHNEWDKTDRLALFEAYL